MRIDLGLDIVPAALRRSHSAGPALPPGYAPVVKAGEPVIHQGEAVIARAGG